MTPEADLIESASDLATLLEAELAPKHQAARDQAIRGASRKVQKLARVRFRRQRKAVLASHALKTLHAVLNRAGHVQEAADEKPKRTRLESDIADAIGAAIYLQPVTAVEQEVFASAVTVAIQSGGAAAADMLTMAIPQTESFIAQYLKDGGFAKLTGDLDQTTVENLARAVADAYEGGADFEGVVQAVKNSFAEATDVRAKMIAQTELNDGFNQSILHFGREAGGTGKEWEIFPGACPVCIENAAAGVIPIEADFPSGDDAAPAHPFCGCSILIHA